MITVLKAIFIEPSSQNIPVEVPYRLVLDPISVNSQSAFQFGMVNKLGETIWTDVPGFAGPRAALMIQRLIEGSRSDYSATSGTNGERVNVHDLGKIDLRK